ncbi:MAG: hypothetical protein P4L67_05650, partial [Candidatus Pacebacteria bacterium]|nr:hypothetical protein [Candidatus Paceibacterota bacterium]
FIFAVMAVAMAGFVIPTGAVRAQATDTPATVSTATLLQELQVAKATLLNLQMKEGMIPQGDDQTSPGTTAQPVTVAQPVPATSGLTASEIVHFNEILSQLAGSLLQLAQVVNAHPAMTPAQTASIATALNGMKGALLSMSTEIAQDEGGAPIAIATPSTGVVAGASTAAPSQTAQTPAAATPAASASTPAVTAEATPATNSAQAGTKLSSVWSFTKANWPVIVIILLVIAILAILFWPEKEAKTSAKTAASAPKAAATTAPGTGPVTVAPTHTDTKQTA